METSNSRKRSFSSSGLPATGSTTTATNHNKKTKKKHSVKQSDGVEAPPAAAITAIHKFSKRHRRREKGKPKDGRDIGLANGSATAGASNQLKLTQTQASSPEVASEPVKQETAAAHKSSFTNLQSNGKNAKTAASKLYPSGQSADAVAEQLKKDRKKAAKARKLRRARELAAREGATALAELDRSTSQKKLKKHVGKNLAQTSDKQRQSASTARAALKATSNARTAFDSDQSRGREDLRHKMLKPFEMDWDVIELKAAEKIAASDVDWNKLTADQRTQLTRHYIGHPSNEFTGSASNGTEDVSETTNDDSDDGSESSGSGERDHPDGYSQPSAAFAPPASRPTAEVSQPQITSAPRVGQSGTFKPLGDRRLIAVPSRLGTVGTLADTKAKFQRLSNALNERRGGGSSDDSDSDGGSESESDDDGPTSKPIIEGSVSETFTDPTLTLKNDPADSEPGSSRPAKASKAAFKPELDSDSAADQDILNDEEKQETAGRNSTVLDVDGDIDIGIASALRTKRQAPSTVSSSSEDEESESQSRASSPELALQTGPSPTAGEPDQEQNDSSSDPDENSESLLADEGSDQLPKQSARQTTTAGLAPLDNNAAESEDESESDAPAAQSQNVNSDDSEHDASEDERQGTKAALGAPVVDSSSVNEIARQNIFVKRREDKDGSSDERLDDKSGSVTEHESESESDEEEIVLNSDGELVLASSLASRQLTPKDNVSGTDAVEPAEVLHGTDEEHVDEDMHDAAFLERTAAQELDGESSDSIAEQENRPDSTKKHMEDEELDDRDDETDASGPGVKEDTTASIADHPVEASEQHLTTSEQQAAGTGSATPDLSTTANVDIKIKRPSQDRGGVPSGLSQAPHALANSRMAEATTFREFAAVATSRPDFDLEEQEEITDTIQSVLAVTRPLPEGEDPDEITASQAGSDHELIKDDGSISQDSTVLSSASANAGHSDKVRMGTPPNHATQDPPAPLDLSDSDTDSSEDESNDSVVAGDDGECTVAEPKCANDALNAGKSTLSPLPGDQDQKYGGLPLEVQAAIAAALGTPQTSSVKKRKMTGNTSLHFATPSKTRSTSKKQPLSPPSAYQEQQESIEGQTSDTPALTSSQHVGPSHDDAQNSRDPGAALTNTPSARTKRSPAKKTGTISEHFIEDRVDLYNTTAGKRRRVAAGESANPFPAIDKPYFGIIQERTWHEPFYLIVATVFLNKTTGRQAAPTFWKIRKRWPTPAQLANADYDELFEMIKHLGLQHQRTKRLKSLAASWSANPPQAGQRHRTLHYPTKGDGKDIKKDTITNEDADDCAGALEIAHLPGCGAYAYDSWRIFCRDVLRGVATDYQGAHAKTADFEPEWKRVLPGDKELRACLRWMWLKEGIIWDPLTGEKRPATEEEMEKARRGELELEDEAEAKFAAQAAGVDMTAPESAARGDDALDESPVKRESVQSEREVAPAVDEEADWALQTSQPQASTSIGQDAASAVAGVETSASPTTRITRAAKKSHLEQVDPEEADTTSAKRRGRPRKAVIGSIQKAERPQEPQPSTVTRSTRAKRQRSPSVEVDDTRGSSVAKRRKTMPATKKEVVKEEAPKRQSARLIDNDGLV